MLNAQPYTEGIFSLPPRLEEQVRRQGGKDIKKQRKLGEVIQAVEFRTCHGCSALEGTGSSAQEWGCQGRGGNLSTQSSLLFYVQFAAEGERHFRPWCRHSKEPIFLLANSHLCS